MKVPAGTVETGEEIAQALLREVREESGLIFNKFGTYLGRFEWFREDRNELHFRNVFQLPALDFVEEEWLHTVTGRGDDNCLKFRYYWLSIQQAKLVLAAEQGTYLDWLV
jgi:putative (di)nucleoside polyphosphate hydrolase